MKDSQRAMGWLASHNRYVHLYINGLYWGIYDPTSGPMRVWQSNTSAADEDGLRVINEGLLVGRQHDSVQHHDWHSSTWPITRNMI